MSAGSEAITTNPRVQKTVGHGKASTAMQEKMQTDSTNFEPQSAGAGEVDSATYLDHNEQPLDNRDTPTNTREPEMPDYLLRYYRWAYVAPAGVWLFDHQPIINAILFGQYRAIMDTALRLLDPDNAGRTLQIASVYGKLTPTLAARIDDLHLVDVAPVQLKLATRKLKKLGLNASLARMNAESLDYTGDSFDTSLMFLLLHEMPPEARRRSLTEAMRVTRPGGHFVVAEYGEVTDTHPLHRLAPIRWTLTRAEPFLDDFWREDLTRRVSEAASAVGKEAVLDEKVLLLGGFYRVLRYRVR